ncbi:hypothetical protein VTK56DRAFT_3254 [Thermocarpiscus australiensis]
MASNQTNTINTEKCNATERKMTSPESNEPVRVVTILAVSPENKELLEQHLLELAKKQIEARETGCLEREVFYLESTGELVLQEDFENRAAAERHRRMRYNQEALAYASEQGWLAKEPDVKIVKSRGGFALRRWDSREEA